MGWGRGSPEGGVGGPQLTSCEEAGGVGLERDDSDGEWGWRALWRGLGISFGTSMMSLPWRMGRVVDQEKPDGTNTIMTFQDQIC